MEDHDVGYSSSEERYQAEVRRAIALSAQNCIPEPQSAADRATQNHKPRPLPASLASALLASNLATPSAIAVSSVVHGSDADRAALAIRRDRPRNRNQVSRTYSRLVSSSQTLLIHQSRQNLPENREDHVDLKPDSTASNLAQFGTLVLDRKKMEAERLERARPKAAQSQQETKPPISSAALRKRNRDSTGSSVIEQPPTSKPKVEPDNSDKDDISLRESSVQKENQVSQASPIEIMESDDELLPSRIESKSTSGDAHKSPVIELDSDSELESNKMIFERQKSFAAARQRNNPKIPSDNVGETVDELSSSWASFSSLPYPRGIVKKTYQKVGRRMGNDISIEEVLCKDELQLAVISAFQFDGDWLQEKIDIRKTRVMLVYPAYDETHKRDLVESVPNENVSFVFPERHRGGIMHSKLMLLKFPLHLRLVVPTGNFVGYDWGETNHTENHVFLIDLPKRKTPLHPAESGHFGKSLCRFLHLSGLSFKLVWSLRNYDFTEANRYGFVYSAASQSKHAGEDADMSGLRSLAMAVHSLGLATDNTIELDIMASSMGNMCGYALEGVYSACRGYLTSSGDKDHHGISKKITGNHLDHLRIYFPSQQTVNASIYGRNGAGTIFMNRSWWNNEKCPRQVFHDMVNVRPKVLSHSKIYFVREPTPEGTKAWAYLGSHNLSKKAWGEVSIDKSGKVLVKNDNWECGVVIPADTSSFRQLSEGVAPLNVFEATIPVPIDVEKSRSYSENSELIPWCQWSK